MAGFGRIYSGTKIRQRPGNDAPSCVQTAHRSERQRRPLRVATDALGSTGVSPVVFPPVRHRTVPPETHFSRSERNSGGLQSALDRCLHDSAPGETPMFPKVPVLSAIVLTPAACPPPSPKSSERHALSIRKVPIRLSSSLAPSTSQPAMKAANGSRAISPARLCVFISSTLPD